MADGTLYIMTGLPYSGKTRLTKELVKLLGFKVVSMHDVMDEKGYDPETMTQENWNEVYSAGYDQLKEYLKIGCSTVLDLGNLKRSERNTAVEIAESIGAKHKLIYINTSVEEIKRRRLVNQQTKERGHLEDETMEKAMSMWEAPTSDENPILYNQDIDLNKWIEKNINEH